MKKLIQQGKFEILITVIFFLLPAGKKNMEENSLPVQYLIESKREPVIEDMAMDKNILNFEQMIVFNAALYLK